MVSLGTTLETSGRVQCNFLSPGYNVEEPVILGNSLTLEVKMFLF